MTRAQALIALDAIGVEGIERLWAAVEHSPAVLDPTLAAQVERMIASSHVRTDFFAARDDLPRLRSRTRGDPLASKFGWER